MAMLWKGAKMLADCFNWEGSPRLVMTVTNGDDL